MIAYAQSSNQHQSTKGAHLISPIYTCTVGVINVSVPFAFRLRSVLCWVCVVQPCGLRWVCVGFAWGFHSMYCPFTV